MKTILAISASNSSESINEQVLAKLKGVKLISLRTYDMPMYSHDYEANLGIPSCAYELLEIIDEYDIIILAVPEYNGNVPAYYKNIQDWCTRIKLAFLEDKEIGLITVTPGKNGGTSVREIVSKSMPFFGAKVVLSHGIAKFTKIEAMEEQINELQNLIDDLR